jgi:hypothetical protein
MQNHRAPSYTERNCTSSSFLSRCHDVRVEHLVPDVGHTGKAPVDAVGVAAGVALPRPPLRLRGRVPLPPVHSRVSVLAVLRHLRNVEHPYGHASRAQAPHLRLHRARERRVRVPAAVALPGDRLRLVVTPVVHAAAGLPLVGVEVRRRHAREEEPRAGAVDVALEPLGPRGDGQLERPQAVRDLERRGLLERRRRRAPQDLHGEAAPPQVRVEYEHVGVVPAPGVPGDGPGAHGAVGDAVVHRVVGVRLHQQRRPVELHRRVVLLMITQKSIDRSMVSSAFILIRCRVV